MGRRKAKNGPMELPARKGFAPLECGSHTGWQEGSKRIRAGPDVFTLHAWSWGDVDKGNFMAAADAARLPRSFGWQQDKFGEYRMYVELIWSYRFDTLKGVRGARLVLGEEAWAVLVKYPDIIIFDTNHATVEIFEGYGDDVEIKSR